MGMQEQRCASVKVRHTRCVPWEDLFADLEGQLAALEARQLDDEVAERVRGERGAVPLADRLRAALGAYVRLGVLGAGAPVVGRLTGTGPGWLLIEEPGGEVVVPESAVLWVEGAGRGAERARGLVAARLDLRHALRGLARDRAVLQAFLVDGSTVGGTIDRVGADAVDLAVHAVGEDRRPAAVQGVRLVPLTALAALRRR